MNANQAPHSTFVWSVLLLVVFTLSNGSSTEIDDIYCLKSIKESLEDPSGYLHSWNFEDDYGREVFVSLENCIYLEALDLSFNQLSGSIPSDISTILPSISILDLSHNRFRAKFQSMLGIALTSKSLN
ncbi:hypothetical protein FNV43_RR06312 [Rhamnella rubrinervis]|uniref:Uncharacterized protein n=1 Tax=Rhamnella rubrinervis TaxID=2594499 RepID=A0A8K0MLC7_9ROSA|nr:hypothetical protein FNV43_RR06312 [Rhamnella rubrinervis]